MSETQNLINSFKPSDTDWLKEGTIGMYHEGVVKGKVKVLSKKIENDYLTLELQNLDDVPRRFPLPPIFEVGKKIGCEGWWGWSILPLDERN